MASLPEKSIHGYIDTLGQFTSFDVSGIGSEPVGPTQPAALNNADEVVGTYLTQSTGVNYAQGFLYANGSFTAIEPPGATFTTPSGINSRGEIVGTYSTDISHGQGFLDINGRFTTVDAPGATNTSLTGINDRGTIVGNADNAGFVDRGGCFTPVAVPGATSTDASGINDRGEIVGNYTDSSNVSHGFLYSDGTFTTIDMPADASGPFTMVVDGINDHGDIVGTYYHNSSDVRGFLATPVGGSCACAAMGDLLTRHVGTGDLLPGSAPFGNQAPAAGSSGVFDTTGRSLCGAYGFVDTSNPAMHMNFGDTA